MKKTILALALSVLGATAWADNRYTLENGSMTAGIDLAERTCDPKWVWRAFEVEELLGKMRSGSVTRKEWDRVQELVAERQMQRYVTCLNSGMDERTAAGAFED